MHETAVAQSVIESIQAEAAKIDKKPVSAKMSCGQFNSLNDEVMQFAFDIAAKDTICEGMTIEIIHHPLRGNCKKCGNEFDFDVYSPGCPGCGSEEFTFAPDAPLLLEEIEFEDE